MKFLLAALNAKYIHTNAAVCSLKAYAERAGAVRSGSAAHFRGAAAGKTKASVEIGEYTINNRSEEILKDIYLRKPDAVGFSCYIWNISLVLLLVRDLSKLLPKTHIWLGGPEVSYDSSDLLKREPEVTGIMIGEGEETFVKILKYYEGTLESLELIDGVAFRREDGRIVLRPPGEPMELSTIPFSYGEIENPEHKIIYYESSRGCPFSCSYCLSSLDHKLRFRDLSLVRKELDFFLEKRVPQVKFVDRTFNCRKAHAMEIWRHITEHDNGVTNFHFEIAADLLDEEELELMARMRPGLIQLEIGVQSVHLKTLQEIRRKTDLNRLRRVVGEIRKMGNIHQHLDLIAGLPFEGYERFQTSFNQVYEMEPDQLQMGFLKVLKGSYMAERAKDYGLVFQSEPPYEVLKTKWMDYGDLLKLKGVEEMVEVYANSRQFTVTMKELVKEFETPFRLFLSLWEFYEERGLAGLCHSRLARYEYLDEFAALHAPLKRERFRRLMTFDLYLRENLKSRPSFAEEQRPYQERVREFFGRKAKTPCHLTEGYEGYEARQLMKMAHLEVFDGKTAVLFDYRKREPLGRNATATVISHFFTEN